MKREFAEVEEFRDRIEVEFGLVFDEGRKEQVEEALLSRRSALQLTGPEYLQHLDSSREEWQHIAELLTVPESYFFRHADHLRAFTDVAIPERKAAHPDYRTLRILCVGCANGEEPYTLSMTLLEHPDLVHGWNVRIRGCDINPEAVRRAERGLYTNWALRATPPACRSRYFTASGNRHRIRDEVRHAVSFEVGNALQLHRPEMAGSLDVVFFRNVLIYFSPEAIRAAINGVAHLLAPGGYLFLGPAETLRGVSDDFHLCHTHETFYYRRKENIGALIPFSPFLAEPAVRAPAAHESPDSDHSGAAAVSLLAEASAALDTAWFEEIGRSADRVRDLHDAQTSRGRLAPQSIAPKSIVAQPPQRSSGEELQRLLALAGGERYEEIAAGIASLPAELQMDSDIQLIRALAQLNGRNISEAEATCRTLLARDSMNAAGHYVLALCREHQHDPEGAAEHDRIAIYLDPSFAMPHLHLAMIARRSGDVRTARREFENANLLLARESASRLMMFGGGFTRDSLRSLCRRELKALGVA